MLKFILIILAVKIKALEVPIILVSICLLVLGTVGYISVLATGNTQLIDILMLAKTIGWIGLGNLFIGGFITLLPDKREWGIIIAEYGNNLPEKKVRVLEKILNIY